MSNPDRAEIAVDLDEQFYPLEAVQNAAYVFTDRAFVRVERGEPGRLKVVMAAKGEGASPRLGELKGEFDNELLHQVLRLRVSESNQKIREFIVTKALVSAQPQALAAAAAGETPCPDCAGAQGAPAAPPQVDEALEKEIDRLLAEIEKGDGAADPLGVSVPWEEKFGSKGAKGKAPAKGGPAGKKAGKPSREKRP